MYLGENSGNLSETKNVFYFQPFLKMRKFLLDKRKDFLIMSNFYVQILSKPNILTIVTSKKILKMSNYELVLSTFFWHTGKTGPRTLWEPMTLGGPRTFGGSQDPRSAQDSRRTQNSIRTKTLWGPKTLRGLRTLWVPRILWRPRDPWGLIILWWPMKDPLAKVSWFPHHVFNLVEFTIKGRENSYKYLLF